MAVSTTEEGLGRQPLMGPLYCVFNPDRSLTAIFLKLQMLKKWHKQLWDGFVPPITCSMTCRMGKIQSSSVVFFFSKSKQAVVCDSCSL